MSTRDQLLTTASQLFRTRGYAAFSYADLADAVGIRKASIHHHFRTKDHLAEAVIQAQAAAAHQIAIVASKLPPRQRLEHYYDYYRALAATGGEICMGGAVTGALHALGPRGQRAGRAYLNDIRVWLTTALTDARDVGSLRETQSVAALVALMMASLQGGLQNARALGEPNELYAVIDGLNQLLFGEEA